MPKTRKRGAGLIGKGSYGCVYRPPIRCNGNTTRRQTGVSKYLGRQNAINEFRKRNFLAPLNADQTFIVYPDRICRPPLPIYRSAEEKAHLDACSLQDSVPTHLIQMNDAGTSLLEFKCPPEDRLPFMKSLLGLCEGLQILHDANIVHLDIKLANIVTKKLSNGSYLTRFIDIGLLTRISDIPTLPIQNIFQVNYPVWPFETRYLYSRKSISRPISRTEVNQFYEFSVRQIRPAIDETIYYTAEGGRTLTPSLIASHILPVIQRQTNPIQFLAKATDVYGFGMVFVQLATQYSIGPLKTIGLKMMSLQPEKRCSIATVCKEMSDYLRTFVSTM